MRRLLRGLPWAAAGYVIGAIAGFALVHAVSPNTHDVAVEAPMTGAFVTGPIAGLVAGVAGAMRARRGVPHAPPVSR